MTEEPMETNIIYNEDCLEGMDRLPDKSIDMILCDLPYGTTAARWDTVLPFDKLWAQYLRVIKDQGAIVLFGAEPFSTMLRMSNLKHYKYDWYWQKNTATGFAFAKYQPMRSVETISVFCKGTTIYNPQGLKKRDKPIKKRRGENKGGSLYSDTLSNKDYISQWTNYPKNVLTFKKDSKDVIHPTQKPIALLEYLIKTYTQEQAVVLDNCSGSGSTAVACLNTNRYFIGFETDPTYYVESLKRIERN